MKQLAIITLFIVISCNTKSSITERIMALKDSCASIDYRLDTLKKGNDIRQNQLLHPSQATGVEKIIEDAQTVQEKDRQQKFMKIEVAYLATKDSLENIKKIFLRQIDSLQLELQE